MLVIICVLNLVQLIEELLPPLLILIDLIQFRLRKSLILVLFQSLFNFSLPGLHQQYLCIVRLFLIGLHPQQPLLL